MFLAQQIRALRGDMSQEEFGKLFGTPQSVVSQLRRPIAYGKFTLQTLLEVAAALNRAVLARIVDFPTFLRFTEDMSEQAICPAEYDSEVLDRFAVGLPYVRATASGDARTVRVSPAEEAVPPVSVRVNAGERVDVANV